MAMKGKKLDLMQEVTTHKSDFRAWPLTRSKSPPRQVSEPEIKEPTSVQPIDYQSHLQYTSPVPFDLYIEAKPILGASPHDPVRRPKSRGQSLKKDNFVVKPPAGSEIEITDEELIYNVMINTYRPVHRGIYEDACLKVTEPPGNVEGVLIDRDVTFRPSLYPSLPPGWLKAAKHWDCLQSRVLGDPTKTFWLRRGPEIERFSKLNYYDLIPPDTRERLRELIESDRLRLPFTVTKTGYGGYRQISAKGVPFERNKDFHF